MSDMFGLDEEIRQEEEAKVVSFEETKKRRPFYFWKVGEREYKAKLTTAMIQKIENKYGKNLISLVTADDVPPLSIMLTIMQGALSPWEHGLTSIKVNNIYDTWVENDGGSQTELLKIVMRVLAVSGFFTVEQAENLLKTLDEEV